MGSRLFAGVGPQRSQQNQPQQRTAIIDQLQQFANQINGDPQQMVNQIVQERGISNEDYNRVVQGARNFMRQFGLN